MRSVLVKPRWIGIHLLAVVTAIVCVALGYWQFERAQEPSREVVSNPVEQLSEARPLGEVLEPGSYMSEDEGNQAVTATGFYDPGNQRLAPTLSPEGEKGYYVVLPLVTGEDTAIAVNRGWIPEGSADSVDRLPEPPDGEVRITGWLLPPDKAEEGYVPIDTPEGHIARIAPSLLVNEWPYRLYEGYIVRGEQQPPAAGGEEVELREIPPPEPEPGIQWNWRSVGYAAQWVVFAGAAIVFWVSLIRRELRGDPSGGDTDGGGDGESPDSGGPGGGDGGTRAAVPEGSGGADTNAGAPGATADGSAAPFRGETAVDQVSVARTP